MHLFPQSLQIPHFASILLSLLAGAAVIFFRLRASNRPTSMRKIIIPPFAMSSGFLMFVVPMTRVPWLWEIGRASCRERVL